MDVHTHSLSSGHHTSDTVTALAETAFKRGLTHLCVTDHAPAMTGAAKESYFLNLKFADKIKYGVNLVYGAELNVLDAGGRVDLSDATLGGLTFAIASLHKNIFKGTTEAQATSALVNAMENPAVCVIGHPDAPDFKINPDALTDAAEEKKVMIELNSAGISARGYRDTDRELLKRILYLCKEKGVYIALGSDSHGKDRIADFDSAEELLSELGVPIELVVNYRPEKFFEQVATHKNLFKR